jgi:TPR repeat protein
MIEAAMKKLRKQLVCLATLAAALLAMQVSMRAQAAGPAIDPALVAKASAGDAAAQVAVGERYAAHAAELHDAAEAAEAYRTAAAWYRKAAQQASIPADMHLAQLYRDGGKGFARDMPQAAEWYRKAAELGDGTAQATLGLLYSIGQGVPQSDVEAYFWLNLAASVKGPKQQQYAANRQMIGTHITTSEQEEVEQRVAKWIAAHPPTENR